MRTNALLRKVLCLILIVAVAMIAGCAMTAPGHDPHGPGNSENAPGHNQFWPGNSYNAPEHSPYWH